MKIGLIAFANDGGLGSQTRRLAQLLKPDRILVIDSSGFSPNKVQHFEWYKEFDFFVTESFPKNVEIDKFLPGLTHVFVVENFYNFYLPWRAKQLGIKTYCQANYEFLDNLDRPYLPNPDMYLMPSYWKLDEMKQRFGDIVRYLPPPMNPDEFKKSRDINLKREERKPRFLHVVGTKAHNDRNGTLDLLEAVKLSEGDFELVIKSQHPLSIDYFLDDKRVKYVIGNSKKNSELFEDYDAVLFPRRWGGLSLGTNEALMSGLPVFMSDITPNKELLPKEWLVSANLAGKFISHGIIEYYSVDHQEFADKIDWFCSLSPYQRKELKKQAFNIALKNFSFAALIDQYSCVL